MLSTNTSSECSFSEEQVYAMSDLNANLINDVTSCPPMNLSAEYDLPRNVFDFDGMHYVNLESIIDDIQNDFPFFAWIKTSNPTSDERVFAVNDRYGGNRFHFGIHDGKGGIYVPSNHYSGSSLVNDDQWHYVGYTWNVTSNNLRLYVDGVEELSVSLDLTIESTDRASLGQEFDGFQASNYYHGQMADISIWSSSVNAGDITLHMMSTIMKMLRILLDCISVRFNALGPWKMPAYKAIMGSCAGLYFRVLNIYLVTLQPTSM